jgi:hypothetical protein
MGTVESMLVVQPESLNWIEEANKGIFLPFPFKTPQVLYQEHHQSLGKALFTKLHTYKKGAQLLPVIKLTYNIII